MSAHAIPRSSARPMDLAPGVDPWVLWPALTLIGLGLVMVASTTLHLAEKTGSEYHYLLRQAIFVAAGLGVMSVVLHIPLRIWEQLGLPLFVAGIFVLMLVLVPGVGLNINGSVRWLPMGPVNLQPSEFVKIAGVMFIAGYIVRHADELSQRWQGLMRPLILVGVAAIMLLAEPDFGATVVLATTAMIMLFLGGARIAPMAGLVGAAVMAAAILIQAAPYRMQRVLTFLDPWADQWGHGFQLTQALLAFGRGEWLGVGLGASVQKIWYLPEAHTDFLFAVVAEELGLLGAMGVILMFALITWRALELSRLALELKRPFVAWLAAGLGVLMALQAFVNIAVNMGLLPTKGLPLPLMSYGGSSMLASCIIVGLLLRVHHELQLPASQTVAGEEGA